jgi:hypothetical protein
MAITGKTYQNIYDEALMYAQIHSDVAFDLESGAGGVPQLIGESIIEEWGMATARKPFNRVTSMTEPPVGTSMTTEAPLFDWYIEYKFVVASVAIKLAGLNNKQIQSALEWYQRVLQEYHFQMARLYPGMAHGLDGLGAGGA